jgi:death on curing protein
MTDYLTLVEVLAIHDDQMERYGGLNEIRDYGQLEAALFRMQSGYYPDVIGEAAALWESLSQNHPFLDGNKRTAFACAYTFLAINGIEITADSESVYAFLMDLYENNRFQFEELDRWLRLNTKGFV